MAELHAVWLAAVFAANTELNVGPSLLPLGNGHLHKLPDTGLVDGGKRVPLHDFEFLIGPEEGARIVAAHAERCLGEVVSAETKKLGGLGDLVSGQSAARNLDHGA